MVLITIATLLGWSRDVVNIMIDKLKSEQTVQTTQTTQTTN